MGPFGLVVLLGFMTLLFLFSFLRYVLLHLNKLFVQMCIPFVALEESTDCLNFIISHVLTHFERDNVIDTINQALTSKINPKVAAAGSQFRLLTLGNAPAVPAVYTFKTDDLGIEWASGRPSTA
jgi:hypothetical protein